MNDYFRAVHAEVLKLKRTSAVMLAVVTPYLVVLLQFFVALSLNRHLNQPSWPWLSANVLFLWAGLVLPIYVSLMAAFLSDIESRSHQWKHLYALPISRGAVYAAKQTAALLLLASSMALLTLGVMLAGWILHRIHPQMGFDAPFPLATWFAYLGAMLAASGLVLAFHVWLSLRWPSFVLAVTIGFLAMIFASVLGNLDGVVWHYFPWRFALNVLDGLDTQTIAAKWWATGLAGGLLFATAGGWLVTRRDVL